MIEGAQVFEPEFHYDKRGTLFEWFLSAECPMPVAQANCSISGLGVIRGIHYAEVPPGQAKYVMCVSGEVMDVVTDLRVGSPTFGCWEAMKLSDSRCHALYLAEGLGHAFMSLSVRSVVLYLCSSPHDPSREHAVNPLDPAIGIDWPQIGRPPAEPVLSERDQAAPTLQEARRAGLLPDYGKCRLAP